MIRLATFLGRGTPRAKAMKQNITAMDVGIIISSPSLFLLIDLRYLFRLDYQYFVSQKMLFNPSAFLYLAV